MASYRHVSAMLQEAIDSLDCRPAGIYVDGTLGGAGHARAICDRIGSRGLLIGIDQDRDAIAHAEQVLAGCLPVTHLFHGSYTELPQFLAQLKIQGVDGIVLDLGLSQHQLESSGRGFSFQRDEPLDMRMDTRSSLRAQDLIADLPEIRLAHIFKEYGEERFAKRIARAVVTERGAAPIVSTRQLADLVRRAMPSGAVARQKIHPATRVFMALRIAVNHELTRLAEFLTFGADLLLPGGRLVILSFHSLEDRLVKQRFRALAQGCSCPPGLPRCICQGRPVARLVTRKALRPSKDEIEANPMARSTRLRVIEKLAAA
jgi:16S rRNA (cytosine1402-N4)-methyltransferase